MSTEASKIGNYYNFKVVPFFDDVKCPYVSSVCIILVSMDVLLLVLIHILSYSLESLALTIIPIRART